jgi:hypothetical protein
MLSKPSAATAAIAAVGVAFPPSATSMAKMWTVDAMRPPNSDAAAASGSTWNGCGSKRSPNSRTSSSVTK